MQLNGAQTKAAVVGVVVLVIGLVYLLWSRSVPPEPVIPAGQSIKNPLGAAASRGPGGPAPSGFSARDGSGRQVDVPAPGTVDPKRGFGPSKGAPIPGSR